MVVESKFNNTGRVLCRLQGALLFAYLLLCASILIQLREPVYIVTALLGVLVHAWSLTSSVSDYNAYMARVGELKGIVVKFVAREDLVRVYADDRYYTLNSAKAVYNKDVDTVIYKVDNKLLYIPYDIDIHTSRS